MKILRYLFLILFFLSSAPSIRAEDGKAELAGRVTTDGGVPLSVEVRVYRKIIENGTLHFLPACSAITDSNGLYSCPHVDPGIYLIQAVPTKSTTTNSDGRSPRSQTLPPFFFPSTFDVLSSIPISIRQGESTWSNLTAPSMAVTTSLEGTIMTHPTSALLTLEVLLDGAPISIPTHFSYDGVTGMFRTEGVVSGHYRLAGKWIATDGQQQAEIAIDVGAQQVSGIKLMAIPMTIVSGEIEGELRNLPSLELRLQKSDDSTSDSVTMVKDGHFQFQPVPPGQYVLATSGNRGVYVDEISVNGKPGDGARFFLAGDSVSKLNVSLARTVKSVSGDVDQCPAGLLCQVIAISDASGQIDSTMTDKDGQFSFEGLKPGDYRLLAWAGKDRVAYRDPSKLRPLLKSSTAVRSDEHFLPAAVRLPVLGKLD